MNTKRSGGMTALGIINIVFGSIGSLLALLLIVGGGLLAAGGSAIEAQMAQEMGAEAEGMGTMARAGGGMIIILGLIGLATWAALAIGGIGVLTLKPWGRTVSIFCGGMLVALNLLAMVTGGFGFFNLMLIIYGGVVAGLFFKPEWKAAFSGQPTPDTAGSTDTEDFRAAA